MESAHSTRAVASWLAPLGNFKVALGFTTGALLQAYLVASTLPTASPELYAAFAAGGIGAWLAWPVICAFVRLALPHGYRSVRFWLLFLVAWPAWTLVTHVGAALTFRLLAAIFDLPEVHESWTLTLQREAPKDLVTFAWLGSARAAYGLLEAQRNAALRRAELEARLAETRLSVLSGQLHPHFLFNALNTVSALMYEDVARADALLEGIAALLRSALQSDRPTWTLHEECAHTRRFVALHEARFGERLRVDFRMPERLLHVIVPRFALQTLVENAVKHNARRSAALNVLVRGERAGRSIVVTVTDDGMGFSTDEPGHGTGLGRLREMLHLLHAEQASLMTSNGERGGASVALTLPYAEPA